MLANEGAAKGTKSAQVKSERVRGYERGLRQAATLDKQSYAEAVAFEREKIRRGEREARLSRTLKGASGEVAADYVGPTARSATSADRLMDENDRVPAPSPRENRDQRHDPPEQ
jgi:hypothetical protein